MLDTLQKDTIRVQATSPQVGAEVTGLDITRPLTGEQVTAIRKALLDHGVIFFRDQPFEPATLKRFGAYFGELNVHVLKGMEGHPEVRRLYADENSKFVSGEEWHSDQSCNKIPPMGSVLCIKEPPPRSGGDTIFASMYSAYDALSEGMKRYLEPLTAVHDGEPVFKTFDPNGKFPASTHPVVRVHPETKRKLIFVNRSFTTRINDVSKSESEGILSFLFSHCEKPEFQTRFMWQANSVAFWDNRCTQHYAVWDYYPQRRMGIRVQIEGDAVIGA